jgi:hypothetical protein
MRRSRILVTAFEPFAPAGKPMRPSNASEEVLRAFGDRAAGKCEFLVLPVDARSEVRLARSLNLNPAGIVAMGEIDREGAWDTNVEVRAWDRPVSSVAPDAPPPPSHAEPWFLHSPFARDLPLQAGMDREDRIGSFWCNRVWFRALQWSLRFERPAIFLHLRVGGDRARQLAHLRHCVQWMESAVPAAEPNG